MAARHIRAASTRLTEDRLATESALLLAALPPRQFRPMHPQPIIAWTPARLMRAAVDWLWEEEQLQRNG